MINGKIDRNHRYAKAPAATLTRSVFMRESTSRVTAAARTTHDPSGAPLTSPTTTDRDATCARWENYHQPPLSIGPP